MVPMLNNIRFLGMSVILLLVTLFAKGILNDTMTIRLSDDFYTPFQLVEINCTSSVALEGDYVSINVNKSQAVTVIYRRYNTSCEYLLLTQARAPCKSKCRCTLDGKSISYYYNVSTDAMELNFTCQAVQNKTAKPLVASDVLKKTVLVSRVSITPSTAVIQNGTDQQFTCTTNAVRPNARIQWYLSNGSNLTISASQHYNCTPDCNDTVESVSTLLFTGEYKDHGLFLYCIASNHNEYSVQSQNVTIDITYGPSSVVLTPSNTSYTAIENTSSVGPIICTADCRPNCTLAWNGPNLFNSTESVLNIHDIHRNQTGNYTCTASNGVGEKKSTTFMLIVNYGPSYVVLIPPNPSYLVNETDNVEPIECSAKCRPECSMSWSGPNLQAGTTSELNLQNISRNQTGNYTCTAINIIGSKTSRNVNVGVNYGPSSVTLSPTNISYTVYENDSVGPITCEADCRPTCLLKWSGSNLPGGMETVLNIQNISRHKAGNFTCMASNKVGSMISKEITVIVFYAPEVNIRGNTSFSENETAMFECIVNSNPAAEIHWQFLDQHQSVEHLNTRGFITYGNSAIIGQMGCLFMGTYVCMARNLVGVGKGHHTVTVYCLPRLNTLEYNISNHITLKENEPLNITVPVLAYPRPWFYWQFIQNQTVTNITNGIAIKTFSNRHTSSLVIEAMSQEMFGEYVIHAGNAIDNMDYVIAAYQVQSERRPDQPSNITCLVGSSYIIVYWQPEFNGGSPQSFAVLYRQTQDSSYGIHHENISELNYHPVRIDNLPSSTVFWLKVNAFNVHNYTASEEIICNTTAAVKTKSNSLIAIGVGAGLGSAAIVLGIAFVIIFIVRRIKTEASGKDKEPISRSNDDDASDSLKDNPLYISSAVICSQSEKRKKHGGGTKTFEMGCVYENSDDILNRNEGQMYANDRTTTSNATKCEPRQNKDGLLYADLDFVPVSAERRFFIRGLENKTNYAIIDLSKKADPLPPGNEDEIEGEKN